MLSLAKHTKAQRAFELGRLLKGSCHGNFELLVCSVDGSGAGTNRALPAALCAPRSWTDADGLQNKWIWGFSFIRGITPIANLE